jgi:hypothetical protein
MNRALISAALLALMIPALGADCVSDGSGGGYDGEKYEGQYDPRYDRESGVPRTAKTAKRGMGKLSYTTEDVGTVYLVDITARQLVFELQLKKGKKFTADPKRDQLYVNDEPYRGIDLRRDNEHAIYFVPGLPDDTKPPTDNKPGGQPIDSKPPPVGPTRPPTEARPPTSLVPADASLAIQGAGDISYLATVRGTVYVLDDRNQLLFKMVVSPGQRVRLVPGDNAAYLDQQRVHTGVGSGTHRIYFGK